MFDHLHYIPILRWKRGEKVALRELNPAQEAEITPLIELIPRNIMLRNDVIDIGSTAERFTNELNEYWGTDIIFIDFENITRIGQTNSDAPLLREISRCAFDLNLNVIPVTTLYKDTLYQKVVKNFVSQHKNGICLRIIYSSILRSDFPTRLDKLLNNLNVGIDQTDLIIDYGMIDNNPDIFSNICSHIPHVASWRSFTFASGAFPRDLSDLAPGQHQIRRHDWIYWLYNMFHNKSERIPTYSDYTIQYPLYVEPPAGNNPSASIRYTSDDYWVIMRGEGLRNEGGTGHAQYPANAQLLVGRTEFCGANFSYGDNYIIEKSTDLDTPHPGTPETWIRAGINHHIAFVVQQLSRLVGP